MRAAPKRIESHVPAGPTDRRPRGDCLRRTEVGEDFQRLPPVAAVERDQFAHVVVVAWEDERRTPMLFARVLARVFTGVQG